MRYFCSAYSITLFGSALPDIIQLFNGRQSWDKNTRWTTFFDSSYEASNIHLIMFAVTLFIAVTFGLSVGGLYGTHLYLLFTNNTTLEMGGMGVSGLKSSKLK